MPLVQKTKQEVENERVKYGLETEQEAYLHLLHRERGLIRENTTVYKHQEDNEQTKMELILEELKTLNKDIQELKKSNK